MGILADFLIKHVRPVGDGWDLLVEDTQLRGVLMSWGLTKGDVDRIFLEWAKVRDLQPDTAAHRQQFVDVARSVSASRWDELYPTTASTILFLDAAQIKELSYAGGMHPNVEKLDVYLAQPAMVAAVTIHKNSNAAEFATPRPTGVQVTTDAQGNVVHFWKLL